MLTPEQLAGLPDSVTDMYSKLETTLLQDIARRIKTAGEMTNSAEWQMIRLQELGMSAEKVKQEVSKISGLSSSEIDRIYADAAKKSQRFDEQIMAKMGLDGQSLQNRGYIAQLLRAASSQTKGTLGNITQSMGFVTRDGRFKPLQAAYQNALDFTQYQVASGGMDYNTAVRQAVKDLADSGIRIVDYSSGVHNHIEVAVRRAVITGVSQVTGKISEQNAQTLGTNYVEVTAHAGARPEHAEWQGKVYCLEGEEPDYPNLADATGYGTVTGLKGANCRHDFFPFVPGISQRAYTDEQLQHIDPAPVQYQGQFYTYYEATQKQRQIETAIRQSKRRIVGYKAAGLDDDVTTESARLQRLNKLYADFSKKADLVTQRERTAVAGFGRADAAKAAAAKQKLTTPKASGNVKPGKTIESCSTVGEVESLYKSHTDWFYETTRNGTLYRSVDAASFAGCDLTTAKGIYTEHDRLFTKFPQLRGKLNATSSASLGRQVYAQCHYGPGHGGVNVNKLYFSDAAKLKASYARDVAGGFHCAGTDWRSIVTHELGHAVDDYLSHTLRIAGMKNGWAAKELSADLRPKVMKACGLKVGDTATAVSGYATKNAQEWFAECFAEYMTSSKPRPVAAEFGRQLEAIMKGVK